MQTRIYTPGPGYGRGLDAWPDMVRDLWSARELLVRLVHRNLTVGYRQSLLGFLWALLLPLLTVGLFAYLSGTRLLPIESTPLPYPVYALWGIVLWQLFAGCVSAATVSLADAGSLVTKVDFPKEIIVLASVTRPVFEFVVKLFIVAASLVLYDVSPGVSVLGLVMIIVLVISMALGFGLGLSLINLVVRDTANLVGMLALFGMFAAPVLYPPPQTEPFALLVVLNPFSPLLLASHDLLAGRSIAHPALLGASAVFALLCLALGWRIFRIAIRRVTERA